MKQYKDFDGIHIMDDKKPTNNELWIDPAWNNKFVTVEPQKDKWAIYFDIIKLPTKIIYTTGEKVAYLK